ncbi:hypothetical protein BI364_07135 [Acidihalobacter yilgarnensis]|uniref:Uncharacterized protein n=1 Tax=Acidihalobacter yilgarnensis TaxID=2819280 RepID=A0A1D8IMR9_9GAMM|nr:hypothetical protein [Acidihalobacter yilgarnensis]AOU97766.1 hypothetical protein BI364_07135 [Acidihalobacter yilgarnensis]
MPSPDLAIVREPQDVDDALKQIGLTRDIVVEVALSAAAARADTLPVDPSLAPGMLSYIFGVRAIRMSLLKSGWRTSRQGNVESTVNDDLGVQLFFQNVDLACKESHDPQAVSGKGRASRHLVAAGQGELFGHPASNTTISALGCTPTVWVICVSVEDFSVRAEVSCPKTFQGPQFEEFHQRIFVLDESFEPTPKRLGDNEDGLDDFDVEISKK